MYYITKVRERERKRYQKYLQPQNKIDLKQVNMIQKGRR